MPDKSPKISTSAREAWARSGRRSCGTAQRPEHAIFMAIHGFSFPDLNSYPAPMGLQDLSLREVCERSPALAATAAFPANSVCVRMDRSAAKYAGCDHPDKARSNPALRRQATVIPEPSSGWRNRPRPKRRRRVTRTDDLVGRSRRMLPRQGASTLPGPTSSNRLSRLFAEDRYRRGELTGLAQMPRPVCRIGRFVRVDPGSGYTGHIRNLWRASSYFRTAAGKRLNHRIHHGGMESVRGDQPAENNSFAVKLFSKGFERKVRRRRTDERVHGSHRQCVAEPSTMSDSREPHGEHSAPGIPCIICPRIATSASASSSENTPARHAATNSPTLCPSIACGRIPQLHPKLRQREFDGENRRLGDDSIRDARLARRQFRRRG